MAHDVLALGVVLRLIVEALDGGHLLPFLRDLDAIADTDAIAVHDERCEERKHERGPKSGEPVELDSG